MDIIGRFLERGMDNRQPRIEEVIGDRATSICCSPGTLMKREILKGKRRTYSILDYMIVMNCPAPA